MGHLVRYRTADGELRHDDAGDLDAALALVEQLRNADDVGDVRVYREVPLRFTTVVKVSVAEDESGEPATEEAPAEHAPVDEQTDTPPPAPVEPPPGSMPLVPPPAVARLDDGETVEVDKRSLFNRS